MRVYKILIILILVIYTSATAFGAKNDSLYFTKVQAYLSLPVHNINEKAPSRPPDIELFGQSLYTNEIKHELFKNETLVFDELHELISFSYQIRFQKLNRNKDRILENIKSIYGEPDSVYKEVDFDNAGWKVLRFRNGNEVVLLYLGDPIVNDMKINFTLSNNIKIKSRSDEFEKLTFYSVVNNRPIITDAGELLNIGVLGIKGNTGIYLSLKGQSANFQINKFQILLGGGELINLDVNTKIAFSADFDLLKSSIVLLERSLINKILNSKLVRFRASGDIANYTFTLSEDLKSSLILMQNQLNNL